MACDLVLMNGWYVLAVFGLLEEFGERGVTHLLCSTQLSQLHSDFIFSIDEAPLGLSFPI